MKKIIVMGGGVNQMPLIQAAKDLKYTVILCDANDKAIGKDVADVFYCIDITNKDLLIDVAKKENADGAVCNTESLMSVLAALQTEMGYVGNTVQSVENLCDKHMFRIKQHECGAFSPKSKRASSVDECMNFINSSKIDVIIKPEKSSGSRGVHVIRNSKNIDKMLIEECFKYSRNNNILVEEYIDFQNKPALEAEVFLYNGRIVLMCLYRTLRDIERNILPQTYCSDSGLESNVEKDIEIQLQKIFTSCGVSWGQYNVEMSFNDNNELFIIEINARQGGMRLPEFVSLYSDVSLNKLLVSTAVKDNNYLDFVDASEIVCNKNMIHYRVITTKSGLLKNVEIDQVIKSYVVSEFRYYENGAKINTQENGFTSIGLIDFSFPNPQVRSEFERIISEYVTVSVN